MAIQERDFERVMNQARVQLPGASEAALKGSLFDVIGEFFDSSNSWTEWVNLTLSAGNQVYQVYPQQGGMLNRLVTLIDANNVTYPAMTSFSDTYAPPGVVLSLLNPITQPVAVRALFTKKVILPNNQNDVPDAPGWLFPAYAGYLQDGLIGTLMLQRGKPYSDPDRAQYHLKRFRVGMAMAGVATQRGGLFGAQAWRFPRGYRASSQRGGVSTPFPTAGSF